FLWSDGGILSCVHAASGEQRWQERVEAAFFGSPICVGDRMMALSKEGELFVVRASDEFQLIAKIELGEPSFATPAVADVVVYLRTLSQLIALGEKTD
ncbi:MAG: serine/threonine protein kinase, partial [Planctomycetota bacterium]|nr:serine/threonine protein kinase [Planctomycetota bacterium]